MFLKRHSHDDLPDLSLELRDEINWVPGTLRTTEYLLNITALAFEPIGKLLAVGTSSGTIHIFGGPGVESKLTLPEPVSVKFLHFSALSFTILCMDSKDCLHVWDLGAYARPKILASQRFQGAVNCMTVSPSHNQVFAALASGEVRAFDLECASVSPFKIPNLWDLYEEKLRQTGIAHQASPESRSPIDVLIHPRNLNLLFIAFEGGVILCDLKECATVRAYELVLRPGAPGGEGYGNKDLLMHRRVPVTAMAIHPTGHFFAVGHADGSIAFWAVDDEDQPLAVRTLEADDVHVVNATVLEQHLDAPPPPVPREPIFKLAWCGFSNSSDPRGGETALAILGGVPAGDAPGMTVEWLPAFNPGAPPAGPAPVGLHPMLCGAMRACVKPIDSYFYATHGEVQDFLLTPTSSPHFAGAFDAQAILALVEGPGGSRVTEAYEFPPPVFRTRGQKQGDDTNQLDEGEVDVDLAQTLADMQVSDDPRRLRLPTALDCGSAGVVGGQLLRLEVHVYQRLLDAQGLHTPCLELNGGLAWCDELDVSELRLAKYEPHRMLLTYNRDGTVRFFDVSAQLLLAQRPNALQSDYPSPLPHLILDTAHAAADTTLIGRVSDNFLRGASAVQDVALAFLGEEMEAAVVMTSGEVVLFRSRSAHMSRFVPREADPEIVSVQPGPVADSIYAPYMVLAAGAPCMGCALTRECLVATSYADGKILVADVRRGAVLLREGTPNRRQSTLGLHRREESIADVVGALCWAFCPVHNDPTPRLRLVTLRISGAGRVYTFNDDGSVQEPIVFEGAADPVNNGLFVIDSKTGAPWRGERPGAKPLLVSVGGRGARCTLDVTGERVGKAEWGSRFGAAGSAAVVEKLGSRALLVFSGAGEAAAYSLPHLEHMHTRQLTAASTIPASPDSTGDYAAWARHATAGVTRHMSYATLFAARRPHAGLPDIEFTRPTPVPQPQPVSAGPASWAAWLGGLTGIGAVTGEQMDAMLAGPDRPPPRPRAQPPRSPGLAGGFGGSMNAAAIADAAEGTRAGLADRLGAAMNERGQLLSDLEQHFNALGEGSQNMVAQAKRLAAQQASKGWFNFS